MLLTIAQPGLTPCLPSIHVKGQLAIVPWQTVHPVSLASKVLDALGEVQRTAATCQCCSDQRRQQQCSLLHPRASPRHSAAQSLITKLLAEGTKAVFKPPDLDPAGHASQHGTIVGSCCKAHRQSNCQASVVQAQASVAQAQAQAHTGHSTINQFCPQASSQGAGSNNVRPRQAVGSPAPSQAGAARVGSHSHGPQPARCPCSWLPCQLARSCWAG